MKKQKSSIDIVHLININEQAVFEEQHKLWKAFKLALETCLEADYYNETFLRNLRRRCPVALNILIIDDEEDIGWSLKKSLGKLGMDVRFSTQPEEGLMMMRYSPDIVLLDYMMPEMDGLDVLKRIMENDPEQVVIMMTAYGTVESAVEAMKLGAFHYIQKPFDVEELMPFLDRAKDVIEMRRMLKLGDHNLSEGDFGLLDGKSSIIKEVFKRTKKVAEKPNTAVLILGESGTGKEMLAKTIHNMSTRKDQLFVALNCSAIPETLLESELFGYEPGAFTGANRRKAGLFEVADGGTLFLDEIGDMALGLQAKILRVLEDGSFKRLGSDKDITNVNVRVIAASNKHLEEMIENKSFREDLYYRLNTFTIKMPPLRERGDDVIVLALKFIERFNRELKSEIKGLEPEAARAIKTFHWPGNVRQLRNAVESSMIECEGDRILVSDLPYAVRVGGMKQAELIAENFISDRIPTLEEVKRAYILQVIGRCKTDQEAADALDISRRSITRFKKDILSDRGSQNVLS